MSGCDAHVIHGAYSQGSAPSAAVFATAELAQGFGVAAVHEGLAAGAIDHGLCGLPHPHDDAVVLAGWVPADICSECARFL